MADTDSSVTCIPGATLQLLGGEAALQKPPRKVGRRRAAPPRFKYSAVERLGAFYGESPAKLMLLLGVNERTAQRRKESGALSFEESDRLARVARVTRHACDIFGDDERARRWLTTANRALEGEAPLHLLASDVGTEFVMDELGRIDYGDLF